MLRGPTASSARQPLRLPPHPGEGPLRDGADEVRPDDEVGGDAADQRPAWAGPGVDDADARGVLRFRVELPDHVHAAGDTFDVAVADGGLVRVPAHLGGPPRRVTEPATEGPPGGHLDDALGESPLFAEADVAVVRQDLGPALDVGGDAEAEVGRRAHEALVDGDHGASGRRREPNTKDSATAGESKRRGGSRSPVAAISAAAAAGARASRRTAASASRGRRTTWSMRCWSRRASRSARRRR